MLYPACNLFLDTCSLSSSFLLTIKSRFTILFNILESYIARIYRWENDNSQNLVGVVEGGWSWGRMAFTNLEELWDILNFKNSKEGGEDRGIFGLGNWGGYSKDSVKIFKKE